MYFHNILIRCIFFFRYLYFFYLIGDSEIRPRPEVETFSIIHSMSCNCAYVRTLHGFPRIDCVSIQVIRNR